MDFDFITSDLEVYDKLQWYKQNNITTLAMDFEEESNLHVFGEHLCIIQLYDQHSYAIIDALKVSKEALEAFLSSDIQKLMFDCGSDCSLCRKTLGIQVTNVHDVRLDALALGCRGNLTAVEQTFLNIDTQDPASKKKYQKANWMKRPIGEDQLKYALADVQYLFELNSCFEKLIKDLPPEQRENLKKSQSICALQKNPEKPGWEKICNYKMLNKKQKIMIRHLFLARQGIAEKRNVPASWILEKSILIDMAKSLSLSPLVPPALAHTFSSAIEKAKQEIQKN